VVSIDEGIYHNRVIVNKAVVEMYVQRKVESPAVFTNVLGIAADAAQNGMTAQLLYQHEAFFFLY